MYAQAGRVGILLVGLVLGLFITTLRAESPPGSAAAPAPAPSGQAPALQLPPAVRPSSDTLALIRRAGQLRVGVALFVPWVMRDKQGELLGFEIDVARQMAHDMGVEVEFVAVPFKELIDDLLEERFDIIISGLYVTPQRALFVNFIAPHATSAVTLLASRTHSAPSHTPQDFNKTNVKIGAVAGTVYEDLAKSYFPMANLQTFSEEGSMLQDLLAGKLHAVVLTSPLPELTAHVHPGQVFLPLASPLATFGESFAIRKGDADFLNYLNTWVQFYQENGWLKERRAHWFESLQWADALP